MVKENNVLVNVNPQIVFACSLGREGVLETAHEPFGEDEILWFFGLVSDTLPHVGCSVHCLEKWVATLRCF